MKKRAKQKSFQGQSGPMPYSRSESIITNFDSCGRRSQQKWRAIQELHTHLGGEKESKKNWEFGALRDNKKSERAIDTMRTCWLGRATWTRGGRSEVWSKQGRERRQEKIRSDSGRWKERRENESDSVIRKAIKVLNGFDNAKSLSSAPSATRFLVSVELMLAGPAQGDERITFEIA